MKVLNIKTVDNQTFSVDWDIAHQSQTLRTMLDDLGIEEDGDGEQANLRLINGPVKPTFGHFIDLCYKMY